MGARATFSWTPTLQRSRLQPTKILRDRVDMQEAKYWAVMAAYLL
jgi:hypothetical protein